MADALAAADAAGIGRCDWIGFSLGGRVAAALAAVAPERVERLVLLDPALTLPPDLALEKVEQDRVPPTFASFEEAVDHELEGGTLFRASRELVAEELAEDFVEEPGGRLAYHWHPGMAVTAWSEMTREPPPVAEVPTLIVLGERSWVPVDTERYRGVLGDRLTVVTLPGGHSVMWDAPGETAEAVAAFLGP